MNCNLRSKYEYGSDYCFSAYITNLGLYNEGILRGEWVEFPVTQEELEGVYKRIGIGEKDIFGIPYEEVFISDYEDYSGCHICREFGEYENHHELSCLAELLDDMTENQYTEFQALVECGDYHSSVKDLINLALNLDKFYFVADVSDTTDYGKYLVNSCVIDCPDYLRDFIDYEKLGKEYSWDGTITEFGYLEMTDSIVDYYRRPDDLTILFPQSKGGAKC